MRATDHAYGNALLTLLHLATRQRLDDSDAHQVAIAVENVEGALSTAARPAPTPRRRVLDSEREGPSFEPWRMIAEIDTPGLEQAMDYLEEVHPQDVSTRFNPVFVFSAGFRSGSTLLQRVLSSDMNTLVWGEPFSEQLIIPKMASQFAGLIPTGHHFEAELKCFDAKGFLGEWLATLNPGIDNLARGHRGFFLNAFGYEGRTWGRERWGIKCVRESGLHARYLQWLFPNAKVHFLVRDPVQAYVSYRAFGGMDNSWPLLRGHTKIDTPAKFAEMWLFLTKSFLAYKGTHLMLDYRMLGTDEGHSALEAFNDVTLSKAVYQSRISGGSNTTYKGLTSEEREQLAPAVSFYDSMRAGEI